MKKLNYRDIKITDDLFGAYVKKVSEKIIPHQWKILNDQLEGSAPTYCISNFHIAAGEMKGKRKGVVFQDTDLYKWLESVAFCIASGEGEEYQELADEIIGLIGRAQEEDGYLNTYFTVNAPHHKWKNLVEGHELYTAGHMIEAAVAYYEATGKDAFLNIAKKNADLICKVFGLEEGKINGYPGHQEIELALIKLYRVTGDRKYLETARYFIEERGQEPNYLVEEIKTRAGFEFFPELGNYDPEYSQCHMKPKSQKTAEGHAVRAMYMCAAMADLAMECDDKEMLEACQNIWDNMINKRMYITGGIGSSGFRERFTTDYDLPNRTNYSETCASIGLMMFGQRMAAVTGKAHYYDMVERALYNTVLAGINIEGDRYFYVNPLEVVPEFCTEHTYMDHVKPVRQKWFGVACCPPNVARTLASLGQYIYAQDEEALYIHQFISSTAKANIGENIIEVKMDSELLKNGTVHMKVSLQNEGMIKIRVPHYATKTTVLLSKKDYMITQENGYMLLKLCGGEHEVIIDFGVTAKWVSANRHVREDIGKVALVKGPLVYCLEEADNGNFLSEIYIREKTAIMEGQPLSSLVGNIPVMIYSGVRLKNKYEDNNQLYGKYAYEKRDVTLKAIPYCLWNNRGKGEMLIWQKVQI